MFLLLTIEFRQNVKFKSVWGGKIWEQIVGGVEFITYRTHFWNWVFLPHEANPHPTNPSRLHDDCSWEAEERRGSDDKTKVATFCETIVTKFRNTQNLSLSIKINNINSLSGLLETIFFFIGYFDRNETVAEHQWDSS